MDSPRWNTITQLWHTLLHNLLSLFSLRKAPDMRQWIPVTVIQSQILKGTETEGGKGYLCTVKC